MKLHMGRTFTLAAGVAALALALPASQAAAEVDFSGQRINVIVSSPPGGGTDGTTRLVARYMEEYLPGNPQHLVRNMPGGHGSKAMTWFYHEAPSDGTTWSGSSSSQLDASNLRREVFDYDPRDFAFIGGVNRGGSVVLVRSEVEKNLFDKSTPPVNAGTIDGTRTWAQLLLWGADELDWDVKWVVGYPGTSSLVLAARRGEVDMMATSNIEMLESLLKTGDFTGLSQYGQIEDGKNVPRRTFPDVPLISEQLKEAEMSDLAAATFDYWMATLQYDKWYALPPKTPQDVVDTYRTSWKKISKDPKFLKEGRNQFSRDFLPMTGNDIATIVDKTSYPKDEYLDYLAKMRLRHGLPAHGLSEEERMELAKKQGLTPDLMEAETELKEVNNGGRELIFPVKGGDEHSVDISGSRTDVFIGGEKTKRSNLKPGMECVVSYPANGMEAKKVECDS